MKKMKLSYFIKIAILAAMASVLMLFDFPLFFTPGFYKLDFSEIPVLIGAFALGPLAGGLIEMLKIGSNLLINGSDTAFVGEFANMLIGLSYIIPSSIFYHHVKSRKGAIIGMLIGILSMITIGSILNSTILLPFYSALYDIPISVLIGMGSAVNPLITNYATFIIFGVAPFNLVKGLISSIIVFLLYKNISFLLKKNYFGKEDDDLDEDTSNSSNEEIKI